MNIDLKSATSICIESVTNDKISNNMQHSSCVRCFPDPLAAFKKEEKLKDVKGNAVRRGDGNERVEQRKGGEKEGRRTSYKVWKQIDAYVFKCVQKQDALTLFARSTSPQGNLRSNSMPVSGVPVGGRRVEASIVKYSTFNGRFYGTTWTRIKTPIRNLTDHFKR